MRTSIFAMCAASFALLLSTPRVAISQESTAGSKLEVHVNYSGTGTVDEKHKIYVALWDSLDFVKGGEAMPLATDSTSSKDGTVTFESVTKTPVYVSTAYDPSGEWDAHSAPPDGTSVGLYSKTPGQPEPVDLKPGKTTKIELSFDDSVKMKGGKATPQ
jgi:hypothetical protein